MADSEVIGMLYLRIVQDKDVIVSVIVLSLIRSLICDVIVLVNIVKLTFIDARDI